MKIVIVPRLLVPSTGRIAGAELGPGPRAHRGLIWAVAVVAGVTLTCGCASEGNPMAPDASVAPGLDAMSPPDAAPCVQECLSETSLRECTGGERTVECPLGCVTGEARCRALVPSNGAGTEHLQGVTAALTVPADAEVIVNTNDGSILIGGQAVRDPLLGVNNGIGFQYTADGLSVFAVQGFTMGPRSQLRAHGDRPFLILSAGDVEIAGTIDVSAGCEPASSAKTCGGPGGGRGDDNQSPATGCGIGANGTVNLPDTATAGGGGGGSGQAGAAGASNAFFGISGGSGGEACAASLIPLRGGSGGGRSGAIVAPGAGGGGGGAVQITSYIAIRLVSPAIIDAGGSGGVTAFNGGGGGGGGGGILLEAPKLSIDGAVLAANGGGAGGSGGSTNFPPGEDGRRDIQQAQGGVEGGLGGSFAGLPTTGAMGLFRAGGGGGGGAGLIYVHAPGANYSLIDTVSSPPPVRFDPQAD
jgi:hypothetical protein